MPRNSTASINDLMEFYTNRNEIDIKDARKDLKTLEGVLRSMADRIKDALDTMDGAGRCQEGHQMTLTEIKTEIKLATANLWLDSAQDWKRRIERTIDRVDGTEEMLTTLNRVG